MLHFPPSSITYLGLPIIKLKEMAVFHIFFVQLKNSFTIMDKNSSYFKEITMIKYPYAKQSINEADGAAVQEALFSPLITRGKHVEEFEQAMASYVGAKYAVAFNSGSTALLGAGFAASVSKFDRLITSPNTFAATLSVGFNQGAEPIFIDIDRKTGNLSLDLLDTFEPYRSTRGRSIYIPVHFGGIPIDMQRLNNSISDPEAIIIEDAAHALGSIYSDGTKVGSCENSAMTIFSFHPAKQITTGEGGMVTTNREEFYQRLLAFRNNGIQREFSEAKPLWYYEVNEITSNYHMNELQAALGLSQLKRLDQFVEQRRKLMKRYVEHFQHVDGIRLVEVKNFDAISFHLALLQIDYPAFKTTREQFMENLKTLGIGTQVHYIPLYKHPFFTSCRGDLSSYFPEMETYYREALSIPLYYDLKEEEADWIAGEILKELQKAKSGS